MASQATASAQPCRNWLVGKCKFGDACRFKHGDAASAPGAPSGAVAGADASAANGGGRGGETATAPPAAAAASSGGVSKSSRPCRNVALYGSCYRAGSGCPFSHDAPASPAVAAAAMSSSLEAGAAAAPYWSPGTQMPGLAATAPPRAPGGGGAPAPAAVSSDAVAAAARVRPWAPAAAASGSPGGGVGSPEGPSPMRLLKAAGPVGVSGATPDRGDSRYEVLQGGGAAAAVATPETPAAPMRGSRGGGGEGDGDLVPMTRGGCVYFVQEVRVHARARG